MSEHGRLAISVGEELPAMSVSWREPTGHFSGYVIFFSDVDPDDEDAPMTPLCLHCLLEEGDAQLARGLDLAQVHGQVDFDVETGEWLVATDQVEDE